jgi:MatE
MSLSDNALRAVTGSRSDVVARLATGPRFDARTRLLLEGPLVGALLRLATPNVLVMVVQASVGLIETYYVAKLGTDALAGVALVFPVLMLMQMMSAGAMGGGISSAIARARRRTPGRRRCVGAPCARHRRDLRARLHARRARRRPMALRRLGRERGVPRGGADLLQCGLLGRHPAR